LPKQPRTVWNLTREFKLKNEFGSTNFDILDMQDVPVLQINGTWESWKVNDLHNNTLATIIQTAQFLGKYHYYDINVDELCFTLKMHRLPEIYYTANDMYISGNFKEHKYDIHLEDSSGNILGNVFPIRHTNTYSIKVAPDGNPLTLLCCVVAIHGSVMVCN